MKTLQEISQAAVLKNKTISEILTLTSQNPTIYNKFFYENIINNILGDEILRKRKDIVTFEDWRAFMEGLALGLQYNYGIDTNIGLNFNPDENHFYKVVSIGNFTTRPYYVSTIDSVLPRAGTKGFFVKVSIEIENCDDKYMDMFWYDNDPDTVKRDIIEYVSRKIFTKYKSRYDSAEELTEALLNSNYGNAYSIENRDIFLEVHLYNITI